MKEIYFSRFVWLGVSTILLVLSFIKTDFKENKRNCLITEITYPSDFDSKIGWVSCPCFTDFCTAVCYCVNLISDKGYIYNEPDSTECTFKSNIIPFKLNFTSMIDTFLNKTIECWYDTNYDIYYINNDYSKDYSKNIFLSVFAVFTFFCLFLEFINCTFYSTKKIGDQELYENPEYINEIPPAYEI